MIRRSQPKGKIVRRFGVNIFEQPKYDKILKKRSDVRGKKRPDKMSDFGRHLVEKQKLRFAYGLTEKQLRNTFAKAKKMSGVTGDNLMILLERRLDNTIYRLNMATTRSQARQIVNHGHVHVNGRKVNIPSFIVKPGDVITVKGSEKSQKLIRANVSANMGRTVPSWLDLVEDQLSVQIKSMPERTEIPIIADEQLVIEFYSK